MCVGARAAAPCAQNRGAGRRLRGPIEALSLPTRACGVRRHRRALAGVTLARQIGHKTSFSSCGALSQMSEPALSSVFRDAAGQGKLAEVQRTLRQGVNVNAVDEDGNTALHRAADKGHMESEWGGDGATRRRAHGADTDLKHELGNTALHYAARNDHMEMVTALGRAVLLGRRRDGTLSAARRRRQHHPRTRSCESPQL